MLFKINEHPLPTQLPLFDCLTERIPRNRTPSNSTQTQLAPPSGLAVNGRATQSLNAEF